MKELQVLIVDDDPLQRKSLFDLLARWGHQVIASECLADAREQIDKNTFDLIILDMRLPDGDGLEFLDEQKKNNSESNIVIVTAYADIRTAIAAIKCGAYDYLPKPFEYEQLEKILRNVSSSVDLKRRVNVLTQLAASPTGEAAVSGDIIVRTEAARKVFEIAQRLAGAGDTTVLILGESGTGKGLLAKSVHRQSPRASRPFIDINCSAIPEQLMESELFGYERGAFTDAKLRKIGLLEAADGGTVFLDEIGDMSVNLQGKLLKVIEEKEFRRLGSARSTHVDIRVIAATSRNLKERIAEGKFREDLFYRLSVFPINLPPLRERQECILPLAEHYLKVYGRKLARNVVRFSPDAVTALQGYAWPGNVRELCNMVERGVILSSSDEVSGPDLGLPSGLTPPLPAGTQAVSAAPATALPVPAFPMSLAESEKRLIQTVLKHVEGNRSKAAEILDIHRTTLYKKIADYGLDT